MEGVERLDEALLDVGEPLAGERDLDRRVPEMPLDDLRVRARRYGETRGRMAEVVEAESLLVWREGSSRRGLEVAAVEVAVDRGLRGTRARPRRPRIRPTQRKTVLRGISPFPSAAQTVRCSCVLVGPKICRPFTSFRDRLTERRASSRSTSERRSAPSSPALNPVHAATRTRVL